MGGQDANQITTLTPALFTFKKQLCQPRMISRPSGRSDNVHSMNKIKYFKSNCVSTCVSKKEINLGSFIIYENNLLNAALSNTSINLNDVEFLEHHTDQGPLPLTVVSKIYYENLRN